MPNTLPELEAERSRILRQFTTLGDLRPGSICAVARRCRQAHLSLRQAQRSWTRSPDSIDA